MRRIDFGNDKISSIRVPNGFTVTIFEDDDYRGDSARIIRSISCFDKKWNDRVSSLSVDSDNRRSYQSKPNYDNDGRPVVGSDRTRKNKYAKAGITGRNVARVGFGNRRLQKINQYEWLMSNLRTGDSIQFKEVSRDENTVLLRNDSTSQRARIDLFANDITVINRNGRSQRFDINSAELASTSAPRTVVRKLAVCCEALVLTIKPTHAAAPREYVFTVTMAFINFAAMLSVVVYVVEMRSRWKLIRKM